MVPLRLLVFVLLSSLPLCTVAAAPPSLLILKQEWGPNACQSNCLREPYGQFVIQGLVPARASGKELTQASKCKGPAFSVPRIPQEVQDRLSCTFASYAGPDVAHWQDLWETKGRCTGMTVSDYFEALAAAYASHNANVALAAAGISLPAVDRNRLLDVLKQAWGVAGWVTCDPDTHLLDTVQVCLNGSTLLPVDCPWDRYSNAPGGINCTGLLRLKPGSAAPPECAADFEATLRGAVAAPAPADAPSTNAGPGSGPDSALPAPSRATDARNDSPPADSSPVSSGDSTTGIAPGSVTGSSAVPHIDFDNGNGVDGEDPAGLSAGATAACIGAAVALAAAALLGGWAAWRWRQRRRQAASAAAGKTLDDDAPSGWRSGSFSTASGAAERVPSFVVQLEKGAVAPQVTVVATPAAPALTPGAAAAGSGNGSGSVCGIIATGSSDTTGLSGLPIDPALCLAAIPTGSGGSTSPVAAQLPGAGSPHALLPFAAHPYTPSSGVSACDDHAGSSSQDDLLTFLKTTELTASVPEAPSSPQPTKPAAAATGAARLADAEEAGTAEAAAAAAAAAAAGAGAGAGGVPARPTPRRSLSIGSGGAGSSSRWGLSRVGSLSSADSQLWSIPFRQLHLQRRIGQGAFGRVYLAEWHATPVAVKVLVSQSQLEESSSLAQLLSRPSPVLVRLQEEADIMFGLRHPNCVQLMGVCATPPCLITEYCARGSLADCLKAARKDPQVAAALTWHRRLSMALDAAKGMLYLHTRCPSIVHRDLKSPNLLVGRHWGVKVSDFNLSKAMGEVCQGSTAEVTNPRWLPPEVLQGSEATPAADVFAFAVVLWELLTWEVPWASSGLNTWQLAKLVIGGGRLPVPPPDQLPGTHQLSPPLLHSYLHLVQLCWQHSPADRPGFADIVAWLRGLLHQLPQSLE